MSKDSIFCVVCEKNCGKVRMFEHIHSHLNYSPHYCIDCEFKSADLNSIIEHEVTSGHRTRQNENNRYLEKLCCIIYKDCLIATKHGYEAVFKPSTSENNPAPACVQNLPLIHSKKAVQPQKKTVESESGSDDDVQLVLPSKNPSVKKNKDQEELSASLFSTSVVPEIPKSKVVAQADSSNGVSSVDHDARDDYFLTDNQVAELDRQINRGHLSQKCNQCKEDVTNNYKSHKEHVLRNHRSKQINEDRDSFISRLIKICFPGAIAVNDNQCGICGFEAKSLSARKTHINKEHLICYLKCPVKECIYVALCEPTILNHLRGAHKMSTEELENSEKSAYTKERNAYIAKLRPYLSRCFPYPIASKGLDKLEKESLADLYRIINNEKDSPQLVASSGTSAQSVISDTRNSKEGGGRASFATSQSAISDTRNSKKGGGRASFETTQSAIDDARKSKESGERASFESTDQQTVPAKCQENFDKKVDVSEHRNCRSKISAHGSNRGKPSRSKTKWSSLSSMNSDRGSRHNPPTSSRQDRKSSYSSSFCDETSSARTGSKRISPSASIALVEGAQSQRFGLTKIHRRSDDSHPQKNYYSRNVSEHSYGHQRDNGARGFSPKKPMACSSNRVALLNTAPNRFSAGWSCIQPFSTSFEHSAFAVGDQMPSSLSQNFNFSPSTLFNPPSACASNALTYGSTPLPARVDKVDAMFDKPQGWKGYGVERSVKKEQH